MNFQEAQAAFLADRSRFERMGAIPLRSKVAYMTDETKSDYSIAMDAQPQLFTDPNNGIPALLTTMVDASVFRILFTPTEAANIIGEVKKGTWLDDTAMFPVVEHVGEVSSYGDFNNNGHTGVNAGWPQRQAYLFQTVKEYGERELERASLGGLNWVAEIDISAADVMTRFLNVSYFFGVGGLQNYGLLNDPNLSAPITPAMKAYGQLPWIYNEIPQATANEVYSDILALYGRLVKQTGGLVNTKTPMILAMSNNTQVALAQTNSFGISVEDLLKKNFPNLTVMTAVQYGAATAINSQGVVGGNFIQLIAKNLGGQDTGFAAFNEKMREHPIIRDMSSFKQKVTGGTWGTVIRAPMAVASMLGV